jgi:tRNA(fMet)-specific endonuclease VapC
LERRYFFFEQGRFALWCCWQQGNTLGTLNKMIAAHAVATHCVLVLHDRAFSQIPGNKLLIEDWVKANQ